MIRERQSPRLFDAEDYRERLAALGDIIYTHRILAGLTRLELGRLLGCTKEQIARYEDAEQLPTLHHGRQMIKMLNINHNHFWQGLRGYAS